MDRLTIGEVEMISKNAQSQEHIPAYHDLSVNIKNLANQLADTMRENERLHSLLLDCWKWCNISERGIFAAMYNALKNEFEPELPNKESVGSTKASDK